MAIRYLVLGAGMQGLAAAYDFAVFGDAESVTLGDARLEVAEAGARRLNALLDTSIFKAVQADVRDTQNISQLMTNSQVCLSAVPYYFNFQLSNLAIACQCHFCDLGGNTDVVWQQHSLHEKASAAGVSIVPDCGLAPGMANILAGHGIRSLSRPKGVYIRVGGLPQQPKPPLGYSLFFNIEGLTNEYFGSVHVLRNGKVTEVETFSELEELHFPGSVGRCEAFMTAGGTSTCPWTFEGKVQEYDEKTIRYPGHYEKMKAIHDLGLLGLNPVEVKGQQVVPRDLFHRVVEPVLKTGDEKDIVLLRVTVTSDDDKMIMELVDHYDPATGFSAMQRTTGFGAAIVAIMLGQENLPAGSIRIEEQVDGKKYIEEMEKRNLRLAIST